MSGPTSSEVEVNAERVAKRLAALQETGLDVGALFAQLGCAKDLLVEGQLAAAQGLCDELLELAQRMAEGSESEETAARKAVQVGRRFYQDEQLAEQVQSLVESRLAEQSTLFDPDKMAESIGKQLSTSMGDIAANMPAPAAAGPSVDDMVQAFQQVTPAAGQSVDDMVAAFQQATPAPAPAIDPDALAQSIGSQMSEALQSFTNSFSAPAAGPSVDDMVEAFQQVAPEPTPPEAIADAVAASMPHAIAEGLQQLPNQALDIDELASAISARLEGPLKGRRTA